MSTTNHTVDNGTESPQENTVTDVREGTIIRDVDIGAEDDRWIVTEVGDNYVTAEKYRPDTRKWSKDELAEFIGEEWDHKVRVLE